MRLILLIFSLFLLANCSPYQKSLDQLGQSHSFSDVEIEDDFVAPEDEPEEEPDLLGDEPGLSVINLKNTFSMESGSFKLAHGVALRWDGCDQEKASRGGYNSDSKCGRSYFHPSFANNLNYAFFVCVHDAALKAGFPKPRWVFIKHLGSYNDRNARNSTRLSNHAYARAWDIVNFNMFDEAGQLHRVSTYLRDYKGPQAEFYDEFRTCWRESLPETCKPGNSEYLGSIGHQSSELGGNSLHNDHLHLSYPLCAGDS